VLDDGVRGGDDGPENVEDESGVFLSSLRCSSSDVGLSRNDLTIQPGADLGGLRAGGINVSTEDVDPVSDEATEGSAVFGRRRDDGNGDA